MKRVILAALLVSVGIQCDSIRFDVNGKNIFIERNPSLEDLKAVCDSNFDKIKETPEYQRVIAVKTDYETIKSRFQIRNAGCESFRKNGAIWFSGVSETDCIMAQMFEGILFDLNKSRRDADDKLEALITKNHPELKQLCLSILERQKTVDLLEKSAQ